MRPWLLLLLSLLVSDLTPPGDGNWVMDYFSWTLCRKLILSGQMAPKGLKTLRSQTECTCFKRNYIYAALLHKQRSYFFCWPYTVHSNHGRALSFKNFRRIMQRDQIPVLAVLHCCGERKPVPAFVMKSNTALLPINDTPKTKTVGQTSPIAMDIIKASPDSRPSLLVLHCSIVSGLNLQSLLLEKPKGWAATVTAQLQKILTERFCVTTIMIVSCCPKLGEIAGMSIKRTSKEESEPLQTKLKAAMGIKILMQHNQRGSLRASVGQRDIFHAATLHSGTSSMKTSDMSQLKTQGHENILVKQKQLLNLNEDSTRKRSFQKQLSLKATSGVNDGGFDVTRQPLLVSKEKKGSRNRPLNKMRPTQDDNNELFIWKMITKQPELRHPEGDSKAEQHTNPMENGNQKRFAYVLQTHSPHKTDIHDFSEKQMLSDVGEESLIVFFLPDAAMETQMDPRSERKLITNTDFRWKVNIPEQGDPVPITEALKDIAIKQYNPKCKCLKGRICLLEILIIESLARKAAERGKTIKGQVKVTTEKTKMSQTTNIHKETTGINNTEHEGNLKPEETVVPSPPSLKMITTEHIIDTTTVNTKITDTTITQSSAHKDDGQSSAEKRPTAGMSPEPEAHTEPGFLKNETKTPQAMTVKLFSGLRMREDVLENLTTFLKGAQSEEEALKSRTETERKEDQNDPRVGSFTFSTHLELIHTEPTDKHAKISGDTVPLCRGLIHRTKAGWKQCKERLRGKKMFASRHPMVTGELQTDLIRDDDNSRPNDEENDHFYYFDGVLKRVQNNYYPHYKKETHSGVPTERQKRDTLENFLSYILRLTLRNRGQ